MTQPTLALESVEPLKGFLFGYRHKERANRRAVLFVHGFKGSGEVTWRKGEFRLRPATDHTRARVELSMRRRADNLVLALSHDHPYDPDLVRSVRLVPQAGELFLDITAFIRVAPVKTTSGLIAGVDPGIIHPLAVACGSKALLVSGRASRAEEFLHLEDAKARDKKMSTKRAPLRERPGTSRQAGSRSWRKLHLHQQ